jgi:signal transduction histidine kinase
MRRKLSWKLAAVVTFGIAIVHGVFGSLRVERELHELEAEAARYHAAMAHMLGAAATSTAARVGTAEALQLLRDANRETKHADIRWSPTPATGAESAGAEGSELRWSVDETRGHITLVSAVPLSIGAERGTLEIRERLTAEEAFVRGTVGRIVVMTLILILSCSAILFAAGWVFLHRPIDALVAKVHRIGSGDLSGPIRIEQDDELGTLGRALNQMCEQLSALRASSERESSARIAALEQLRHADRLTTVGKLASGLAHELGTPLNVVSARARMIARRQSQGEEAVQDAEVIVGQTERMTRIIRQLLDFARRRKPARARAELFSICRQAVDMLAPLARKSDVELELPDAAEVFAEVDSAQLQQVLTNLVMNAIQAQPDGGAVRVRVLDAADAPPVQAGELSGPHVAIVVDDEGPGMSEEVRERLFEPFFTTKDIGQGTGLGLSVAYGIIREHGGWIDVQARPDGGSRFVIHLPAATS